MLKFTATDRTSVTPPALLISRNVPWPEEKKCLEKCLHCICDRKILQRSFREKNAATNLAAALSSLVQQKMSLPMAGGVELDDLQDPFQTQTFYDSMIII